MRVSGRERILLLLLVGVIGTVGAVAGYSKWSSSQVLSNKIQARELIEGLETPKGWSVSTTACPDSLHCMTTELFSNSALTRMQSLLEDEGFEVKGVIPCGPGPGCALAAQLGRSSLIVDAVPQAPRKLWEEGPSYYRYTTISISRPLAGF
jgi:hypothetical protein